MVMKMSKKRVTSFDVARAAGVSRSVVSAILNGTPGIGVGEEKRQAVLDAIRELDYHVDSQARGMKIGKSECIAVYGNMDQPMFLQLLTGVNEACGALGYHVLLYNRKQLGMERQGLTVLYQQKRIDGVITLDSTNYADPEWAEAVKRAEMPYVSVEGYANESGTMSVLADYRQSVLAALDYLYRQDSDPSPLYVETYKGVSREGDAERSRREAYLEWCALHGAEPVILPVDLDREQEGRRLLAEAMESRSQLILLSNWTSGAVLAYRVAYQTAKRVGREVRIMSADNTYQLQEWLVPSMSAMEVPYRKMGQVAVEALMNQIDGKNQAAQAEFAKIRLKMVLKPGESA